jgi:hypothetical protein
VNAVLHRALEAALVDPVVKGISPSLPLARFRAIVLFSLISSSQGSVCD